MIESLVSTIIPVYNRGAMLREAVASVLAQDWRPIEILIVDDGSGDDTPTVMAELQAAHPGEIRLLHQANAGPGVARQAGLEQARGEFVQFLDSDDLLLAGKFRRQVEALRADPQAEICYGKVIANNDGVRDTEPAQRSGERLRTLFPAMLDEPLWPTLAPLYRRSLVDRIGAWPRARQLEDWVYDAQAGAAGARLAFVDEFVAETRNHGEARLCHLWKRDRSAMRERIEAYFRVHELALASGLSPDTPEMQRFARTLFWMSRTAGAHGFPEEARRLFELARADARGPGWDFRVYRISTGLLGWRLAGRVSEMMDRWRA